MSPASYRWTGGWILRVLWRRYLDDHRRLHRRDRPTLGAGRVSRYQPGGSLAGITGLSRLSRVRPASRASTTLDQVIDRVPHGYLAVPGDPAAPLLSRSPLADDLAAIVISDGRITGIVITFRLR